MSKSPRVVFVDVSIRSISPLKFDVVPSPKNVPPLPSKGTNEPGQPEIVFSNDGNDGFIIHFELQGDTHGYFFPAVEADAVWSQRGTACPDETGVWDVFNPIQVVKSGNPPERRTLIVKNLNPDMGGGKGQGKFRYNLRVTNGSDWKNLDPPGDNTNGGSSFTFSSFLTVGGVTGVIVGIGTAALVSNGFIAQDSLLYGIGGAFVGLMVGFLFDRL